MTKMKFLAVATLISGAFMGAASADEPYVWPLCDQLTPLIEAGTERTPFMSLSENTRKGESIGYMDAPTGLKQQSEKKRCMVYVAGNPEGVVGGGKYNKVECTTWRSKFGETVEKADADVERAYLGGILGTCSVLAGWQYQSPDMTHPRIWEDVWTNSETGVQVLSKMTESRTGCKRSGCSPRVSHEVEFIVRNENPSYVDPDELLRAQQAAAAKATE